MGETVGRPGYFVARARMQALVCRPLDRRCEPFLQYRLDINEVERVKSRRRVPFSTNIPTSLPSRAASRAVDPKR